MPEIDVERDPTGGAQEAQVRLYTLEGCGACWLARRLLQRRGVRFEEIRGDGTPGFRQMLREATGSPTVPQVLVADDPVGGADSLYALDRLGVLLPRLRNERFPVAVVRRRRAPSRLFSRRSSRYVVRLVDRDGRRIEEVAARSIDEAERLAEELQAGVSADSRSRARMD